MVIIESSKINNEHFIIDNSMISIFSKNKEVVYFVGELKLFKNQEAANSFLSNVHFFCGVASAPRNYFISRWLFEARMIFIAAFFRVFKKESEFVFLSLSPFGHLMLSILNSIFEGCTVHVIIHQEICYLYKNKKKLKDKFMGLLMRLSLKIRSKKIIHVVLSDHINASKIFSHGNFIKLNHPCVFQSSELSEVFKSRLTLFEYKKIVFTFVGMASNQKGLGEFLEISNFFKDSDYIFNVSGKVVENNHDFSSLCFYSPSFVSQEKVDEILKKTCFSLFFYGDEYDWIASGAILDCVKYQIPIISLRSKIFAELELKHNFVKCFNSVSEIIDFISCEDDLFEFYKNSDFCEATSYFGVDAACNRLNSCIVK